MSERFKRVLARVPLDVRKQVSLAFEFTAFILDVMDTKGISSEELAERMKISEETLYEWFKGTHDFTFNEIVKFEIALDVDLILMNKNFNVEKRI